VLSVVVVLFSSPSDLSSNACGKAGALKMVEAVESGGLMRLRALNLSHNRLEQAGVEQLVTNVKMMETITSLDLTWYGIGRCCSVRYIVLNVVEPLVRLFIYIYTSIDIYNYGRDYHGLMCVAAAVGESEHA
jgi:hypothetical protein